MRDKQIEEMTKDLCDIQCNGMRCNICDTGCEWRMLAIALYNVGYRKASDVATEFIELIDDHFAKVREVLEEHLREYRPGYQREFIFDLVDVLQKRIVEKIKKKYLGEDINAPTKESEKDNGN